MDDETTKDCPECGAENEAEAMACVDCGADLSSAVGMDEDEDDMDDDEWVTMDDDEEDGWDDDEEL